MRAAMYDDIVPLPHHAHAHRPHTRFVRRLSAWDRHLFHSVATRHWPGADALLPRLSHSANHGLL